MKCNKCCDCNKKTETFKINFFGVGYINVCVECLYKSYIYINELDFYIHYNDYFISNEYKHLNNKYGLDISNKGVCIC